MPLAKKALSKEQAKKYAQKSTKPKRGYDDLTEKMKISRLFGCIQLVLVHENFDGRVKNPFTIAAQYGRRIGLKAEDFDLIKDMTIREIVQKVYSR